MKRSTKKTYAQIHTFLFSKVLCISKTESINTETYVKESEEFV